MKFPLRSKTSVEAGGGVSERRARYRAGLRAERLAALYLRVCGYRIIGRRFKCPVGEIDLIARRFGHVAFIEVKRRANIEEAAFSIGAHQRRRIGRAAAFWLAQNEGVAYQSLSLDAVLVARRRWPQHIRAAFEAE